MSEPRATPDYAVSLEQIADELDRARTQESKPQHLRVHARRNAVKAMRQLLAAVDAGASLLGFPLPFKVNAQSDDALFQAWCIFATARLRAACPSAFAADAGAFDFPPAKLDNKGKVSFRPDGEPATVIDDYDDTDALSHMRAQAQDWADACRAAARLLREQIPHRQALAQASAEPPVQPASPAMAPYLAL